MKFRFFRIFLFLVLGVSLSLQAMTKQEKQMRKNYALRLVTTAKELTELYDSGPAAFHFDERNSMRGRLRSLANEITTTAQEEPVFVSAEASRVLLRLAALIQRTLDADQRRFERDGYHAAQQARPLVRRISLFGPLNGPVNLNIPQALPLALPGGSH